MPKLNDNFILWFFIYLPILIIAIVIFRSDKGSVLQNSEAEISEKIEKNLIFFENPPDVVRAVYLTSISAGNPDKISWLINLKNNSQLNSVVIDVKDYSGYIGYDTDVDLAHIYDTERVYIKDIRSLLDKLHEHNIYTIARITVFQDPALIQARPDWAVQNKNTGRPWTDNKGLSWIDPTNREAWKYLLDISEDALIKGFDEVNLDYIRFPSDGNLDVMVFNYWDRIMSRPQVLNEFFKYMRTELGDARLSADLFGFVTTRTEDFGVGQVMEDAFEYFDFVSPMVYPSHYPAGFMGFASPAAHPYEVIKFTLSEGHKRLEAYYENTGNRRAKIRPWLQDFNLVGVDYTQAMVEAEIRATQDALGDGYNGFMLWNARNVYHEGVF